MRQLLHLGIAILGVMAPPGALMAEENCLKISQWMNGGDGDVSALVAAQEPPACGSSLGLSGAKSVHCAWPFAYRAAKARAEFEALSDLLEGCFKNEATAIQDQLVNHPDSYDLKEIPVQEGRISASIKDKGALQQTFIFLRAERFAK